MTVDDRLVSGASSESSLPPNKSSGDIVERLLDRSDHYLPDWADAAMKEAAAEIERLRREVEELPILRDAVCRIHNREWADGDPVAHISHAAAMWKIADDTLREIGKPGATSTNEVKRLQVLVSQSEAERYKSCGELLNRALTAESAVAAAWEEAARVAKDRWREWRSSYEDDLDGMDACEDISKAISARASRFSHAINFNPDIKY